MITAIVLNRDDKALLNITRTGRNSLPFVVGPPISEQEKLAAKNDPLAQRVSPDRNSIPFVAHDEIIPTSTRNVWASRLERLK